MASMPLESVVVLRPMPWSAREFTIRPSRAGPPMEKLSATMRSCGVGPWAMLFTVRSAGVANEMPPGSAVAARGVIARIRVRPNGATIRDTQMRMRPRSAGGPSAFTLRESAGMGQAFVRTTFRAPKEFRVQDSVQNAQLDEMRLLFASALDLQAPDVHAG